MQINVRKCVNAVDIVWKTNLSKRIECKQVELESRAAYRHLMTTSNREGKELRSSVVEIKLVANVILKNVGIYDVSKIKWTL